MGTVDPCNKMIRQEYAYHQHTFCGALSMKPRPMDCSVGAPKEVNKMLSYRRETALQDAL